MFRIRRTQDYPPVSVRALRQRECRDALIPTGRSRVYYKRQKQPHRGRCGACPDRRAGLTEYRLVYRLRSMKGKMTGRPAQAGTEEAAPGYREMPKALQESPDQTAGQARLRA
jgi:hypothetical protein